MAWITDRMAEKLAARLTLETYRFSRPDLIEAVDQITRALTTFRELGARSSDLADLTAEALDVIADLNGTMVRTMDEHGMWADAVDVSELRALHERITT